MAVHEQQQPGRGRLRWGRCPECSSRLRVKRGPYGRFLGCTAFPSCDFTKPLDAEAKDIIDGFGADKR